MSYFLLSKDAIAFVFIFLFFNKLASASHLKILKNEKPSPNSDTFWQCNPFRKFSWFLDTLFFPRLKVTKYRYSNTIFYNFIRHLIYILYENIETFRRLEVFKKKPFPIFVQNVNTRVAFAHVFTTKYQYICIEIVRRFSKYYIYITQQFSKSFL